MWELDHKESWAPKNWCFWTVVLEKTLLLLEKIPPVHPKGNQSWIFTGRTDAEAETPILWPLMQRTHSLVRPWCWERLKVGGGDDKGWYRRMASQTRWTWVWVSSGSWWWTGNSAVLQSMGLQKSDKTELLNWNHRQRISVDIFVFCFSEKYPEVELQDSMVILLLIVQGTFFHSGCTNVWIQSHQQCTQVPFSPILANTCYFLSFRESPFQQGGFPLWLRQ